MTATWKPYDLATAFPTDIDNILHGPGNLDDILDQVQVYLDAFKTSLGLLSATIIAFEDPISGVTKTLVSTLRGLVEDLKSTPIYSLYVTPFDYSDVSGYLGFKEKITNSFIDTADFARPNYSDTAWVGALIVAAGCAEPEEFATLLGPLAQLVDFKKFTEFADGVFHPDASTSKLLFDVKASITTDTKKMIAVTSVSEFPKRGGMILIEQDDENPGETAVYNRVVSYNGKHYLEGVVLLYDHKAFSVVKRVHDIVGVEPKAALITDVGPGAAFISVDDNANFPNSGVLQIGNERIPYNQKNVGVFTGVTVTEQHYSGDLVFFKGEHPGKSQPPDWNKTQLLQCLPVLESIYSFVDWMAQFLAPAENLSAVISAASDMIDEKLLQMRDLQTELDNQITFLQTILTSTGLNILLIEPDVGNPGTGIQGLINTLESSSNNPNWPEGFYTGGIMLVVGSNTLGGAGGINTYWDSLKTLFGE